MISVGEIETCDVHACVNHFDEHFDVPAGGSESANDLGFARLRIDCLKNVLEFNAARVGASRF